MKFIAREKEISKIQESFNSPDYELILVYGRRHVGKAELIKHCCGMSGKKVLYYMCRQVTQKTLTQELTAVISQACDLDGLMFASFEDALKFVYRRSQKEELILILDEYPNARAQIKGLDTMLQSLSDEYKGKTDLKVILSGSYIDIMKSLKGENEPLYGRITLSIDLKQMDYYDSARFYPSFSNEEKVQLFSIFGGIPLYNSLIRSDLSVKDNVIKLIASPDARLSDEVSFFLTAELSKLANANSIFDAMANGEISFSEIQKKAGIDSSSTMTDLMNKLIGMEVVRKEFPINKEKDRTKSHYYIDDNLSHFYYRYLANHMSPLQIMPENRFWARYIESDFNEHFVPFAFEKICRQFLIRKNMEGVIEPPIEKIGKFYYDDPVHHKNGEFDVVTQDEKGYIFYEAKYRSRPVTNGMIQKEIEQVRSTNLNCYNFGFFSRSGFSDNIDPSVITYTLEDLYR